MKSIGPVVALALCIGCASEEIASVSMVPELPAPQTQQHESHLLVLKNDAVVVAILPDVGGRVVVLRRPDGNNVLKSHPEQWDASTDERITPSPDAGWKGYNGHIVWLGPQSGFWTQQDANANRKKHRAGWPPDPYLIYGSYEVSDRTPTSVTMTSPKSEVSGLQLTKKVSLAGDGVVTFEVTGTNIRTTPVSWDLWSNTRMEGVHCCYVPLARKRHFKLEFQTDNAIDTHATPYRVVDGMFTFSVEDFFATGAKGCVAKAFIDPAEGTIVGFTPTDAFVKKAERVDPRQTHPQQSFVEIYQQISATDPKNSLLELEMHGPFETLAPGESMSWRETWRVMAYDGPRDPASHAGFARANGLVSGE